VGGFSKVLPFFAIKLTRLLREIYKVIQRIFVDAI